MLALADLLRSTSLAMVSPEELPAWRGVLPEMGVGFLERLSAAQLNALLPQLRPTQLTRAQVSPAWLHMPWAGGPPGPGHRQRLQHSAAGQPLSLAPCPCQGCAGPADRHCLVLPPGILPARTGCPEGQRECLRCLGRKRTGCGCCALVPEHSPRSRTPTPARAAAGSLCEVQPCCGTAARARPARFSAGDSGGSSQAVSPAAGPGTHVAGSRPGPSPGPRLHMPGASPTPALSGTGGSPAAGSAAPGRLAPLPAAPAAPPAPASQRPGSAGGSARPEPALVPAAGQRPGTGLWGKVLHSCASHCCPPNRPSSSGGRWEPALTAATALLGESSLPALANGHQLGRGDGGVWEQPLGSHRGKGAGRGLGALGRRQESWQGPGQG